MLILMILWSLPASAQLKTEREHRIKRSYCPDPVLKFVEDHFDAVQRVKFYRETDSSGTRFPVKFKKARLHYTAVFDGEGQLLNIRFRIREVDLPREVYSSVLQRIGGKFARFRIRSMEQEYTPAPDEAPESLIRNAFQNLLLPSITYRIMVGGRLNGQYEEYVFLFDSEGRLKDAHPALPANRDHVLY